MFLEIFKQALNPLLIMFTCLALGFMCKKLKVLPDNTTTVLSKLATFVIIPAVTLNANMRDFTVEYFLSNWTLFLYSALALAVAFGMAYAIAPLFKLKDAYKKKVYTYALTFANFGYMGTPIAQMLLGANYINYVIFTFFMGVMTNTWGVIVLTPKEHRSGGLLKAFLNVPTIALFVSIILGLTGLGNLFPEFAVSTIAKLDACYGPIAMILTGFLIGGYEFKSMLTDTRVYIATFLRLFILPAIILVVMYFVGANYNILVCVLIAYAGPLGLNTVVFPAAFGGDPKTGAGMALISHTFCVVTIPIMYALLQVIVG